MKHVITKRIIGFIINSIRFISQIFPADNASYSKEAVSAFG
jgi:hypothetical protein